MTDEELREIIDPVSPPWSNSHSSCGLTMCHPRTPLQCCASQDRALSCPGQQLPGMESSPAKLSKEDCAGVQCIPGRLDTCAGEGPLRHVGRDRAHARGVHGVQRDAAAQVPPAVAGQPAGAALQGTPCCLFPGRVGGSPSRCGIHVMHAAWITPSNGEHAQDQTSMSMLLRESMSVEEGGIPDGISTANQINVGCRPLRTSCRGATWRWIMTRSWPSGRPRRTPSLPGELHSAPVL